MERNKISLDRLKELKREMANKFEYSFGHSLTDQEREQNWQEYQKLRTEYLSEYQKLTTSTKEMK